MAELRNSTGVDERPAISVFDLFSVGIGPSSSHTVGPMRAARLFVQALSEDSLLGLVAQVRVELFGSLGATGPGHGTIGAVVLGLCGEQPETVQVDRIDTMLDAARRDRRIKLNGIHEIGFDASRDIVLSVRPLPAHPNGMRFTAISGDASSLAVRVFYSVGGGFVTDETLRSSPNPLLKPLAMPFTTAAQLCAHTNSRRIRISDVMMANERSWRSDDETRSGLLHIWSVMNDCIERGITADGTLPGGLGVRRRAGHLHEQLVHETGAHLRDPLNAMDWVNLFALAVNEENAAGGRVVTAPTNGAAGIIPATLRYYDDFIPGADQDGIVRFLLTAGAIGVVIKSTASISGAEVGCQGEVGSACSMAAAGLAEVLGGTPAQVENAAEIAMEHNLGLTCDPIGGLVQVPCIERNAMASVKAINAARIALRGDGTHLVSLGNVIKTMREIGADMHAKYKETSLGGLAVNVVEC